MPDKLKISDFIAANSQFTESIGPKGARLIYFVAVISADGPIVQSEGTADVPLALSEHQYAGASEAIWAVLNAGVLNQLKDELDVRFAEKAYERRKKMFPGFVPKPKAVPVEVAPAKKVAAARTDDAHPGVENEGVVATGKPIKVPAEILSMIAENRAELMEVTRAEAARKAKEAAPRPAAPIKGNNTGPLEKAA